MDGSPHPAPRNKTTQAEPAAAKGFGKAAAVSEALLDGENYVAKPADAQAWAAYVEEELSDAVKQVG